MEFVEDSIRRTAPSSKLLVWQYTFNLPGYGPFPLSPLRLVSRTVIVCITTVLVSHSSNQGCRKTLISQT